MTRGVKLARLWSKSSSLLDSACGLLDSCNYFVDFLNFALKTCQFKFKFEILWISFMSCSTSIDHYPIVKFKVCNISYVLMTNKQLKIQHSLVTMSVLLYIVYKVSCEQGLIWEIFKNLIQNAQTSEKIKYTCIHTQKAILN